MIHKKMMKNFFPECKTCVHFIKEDGNLSTKLKNVIFKVKIIGSCSKLLHQVKEDDLPKCQRIYYKHYLNRLLD
jgi:hypothetical protein